MALHDASFAGGFNGTTATLTGVAIAANSNRVLYVWINIGNISNTVNSVVRDGQSATQIFNQAASADVRLQCWRILAPNTGTASVVVTMSASTNEIVVGAVSLYNVDQTTPEGTFTFISSSPSVHPYQRSVTSNSVDDIVLDCVGISTGSAGVTSTAGSGQTQRFQDNSKQYRTIHGSTKPGAVGTVTVEQTPSTTLINSYMYSAVNVNNVSAAIDLAASPSSISTVTAELTTNIQLASNAAAVSTLTGELTGNNISASIVCNADSVSTLTTGIKFACAALCVATSTSALSTTAAVGWDIPTLTNNTSTVLANEVGVVVNIYNSSTGALVLRKTGLTSDASGVVFVRDNTGTLVASTVYSYEVVLSSNGRRLPTATAS